MLLLAVVTGKKKSKRTGSRSELALILRHNGCPCWIMAHQLRPLDPSKFEISTMQAREYVRAQKRSELHELARMVADEIQKNSVTR